MILIDTNVLVAYLNERDTLHDRAVKLAEKISGGNYGPAIISEYIFDETVTVLSARAGRKQAIMFGNDLLKNFDIIQVTAPLFRAAWWLFKGSTGLSFTDCTNIAMVKELEICIATFDNDFRKAKVTVVD